MDYCDVLRLASKRAARRRQAEVLQFFEQQFDKAGF